MALVSCRECAQQVSSAAPTCPHCGVLNPSASAATDTPASSSPTEKPKSLLGGRALVGIGAGILFLAVMASNQNDQAEQRERAKAQQQLEDVAAAREAARAQQQRTADSLKTAMQPADLARIAEMRPRFELSVDKINSTRFLTPNSQTAARSYNRSYLGVVLRDNGSWYMKSQYTGDDWVFHDRVIVRIGDRVMESAVIPSYDDLNSRENSGGTVWETISYTEDRDNGILRAIAEAPESTKVVVRFQGGDRTHTIDLSATDRRAIREGVELADILKRQGSALIK